MLSVVVAGNQLVTTVDDVAYLSNIVTGKAVFNKEVTIFSTTFCGND